VLIQTIGNADREGMADARGLDDPLRRRMPATVSGE
jgi:hypothetical protein